MTEKKCLTCANNGKIFSQCAECRDHSNWRKIIKGCLTCKYENEIGIICENCILDKTGFNPSNWKPKEKENSLIKIEKKCSTCDFYNLDGHKCNECENCSNWKIDTIMLENILKRSAATQEPMPTGNGQIVITEIIRDLLDRDEVGQKKYNTSLKTNNGRDALMDAYQEACDLVMYLKQALIERDNNGTGK